MHGHRPPPCPLSLLLSILQFLLFSSNTSILHSLLPPAPEFSSQNNHSPPWPHHGYRKDCWNDGAPYTLIEARGDRYINLNRGNGGQKDWKEVADIVNNRQNGVKPKKTDVQCKNRIVMLKKKYKIEKSKPPPLSWPLCNRLDSLIGTNSNTTYTDKKPTSFTVKSKKKPKKKMFSGLASYSESSSDDDVDDMAWFEERLEKKRHRMEDVGLSDGAACRELARAILKFGEIPERIESSRQRQMIRVGETEDGVY